MKQFLITIEWIILIWLIFSILYILVYAISGHFYKIYAKRRLRNKLPRIALFIPAYKEDAVIVDTAKRACKQDYRGRYDVIVIADSLQEETLLKLKDLPIRLIEVDFLKSTKTKALNRAMDQLYPSYDLAIILDADNVMERAAINEFSHAYRQGYKAIQGRRVAKNLNTNFAFLDGISEGLNNHVYSKGPAALKLSSRLVGSAMAFDYNIFRSLMKQIKAVGGFDKELELLLIQNGLRIEYVETAIVYDEKVSKSNDFAKQRTRWISAQYQFMWRKMPMAIIMLLRGNFDYFYKAIQLALPPRLLMPIFISIMAVLGLVQNHSVITIISFSGLLLNIVAYSIAIPKSYWNKQMVQAFWTLPKAAAITILCLFKLKRARKTFIHTPHENAH